MNVFKYKQGNYEIEFSTDTAYWITSVNGLSENSVSLSTSQGVGQVGSTLQTQVVKEKTITVNGVIMEYTKEDREKMLSTIVPAMTAKWTLNDEYELEVTPTSTPMIENYDYNAKFQFILKAPYPYWKKIQENSITLTGIEDTFKFPWNLTKTWSFGKRMESFFGIIHNVGVECSFIINMSTNAEVKNPFITNVKTGEYIKLNKTISAGENIIIDTTFANMKVTSKINGIITDVFNDLDIYSNLFILTNGDNVLKADADENRDNLDCIITYNLTFAGL